MLRNCESLYMLLDISNLNILNEISMIDVFDNYISLCCGKEILKMKIDNLIGKFFNNDCINFQRNVFNKYIDKLYKEMINENEILKELIEQIYEEYDNTFDISFLFMN